MNIFNLFPGIPILLLLIYPFIFKGLTVSSIMYLLINIVSFCIFLYSTWYMKEDKRRTLFMVYLTFFTLFMNLLTIADDYIIFFIGWEGVGLSSFLLIGFWFENKENTRKAKQAFLLTKLSDIGYIIGAGYLIYNDINFMAFENSSNIPLAIRFLMFLPCIGKSALFPLFIWLPNAMVAPTPVSAHLHSATMVAAGVFYLTKFQSFFSPLFNDIQINYAITYLIITGYFLVSFLAFIESDIKKLLAYSTISHLSLMYLGFLCASSSNIKNYIPFLHMILHAFTKAPLFLIAGVLIHKYHSQDLNKLRGTLYANTLLKATFLLLILSLSGFIFIGTFWSKFLILIYLENKFHSEALPLIITILSSAYCARFYFLLTKKDTEHIARHQLSITPIISIILLSIFLIGVTLLITFFQFNPNYKPYHIYPYIKPLGIEFILIVLVFTITYLFPNSVEQLTMIIRGLKKHLFLERIYYNIFQIPTQFVQFLCRTHIEEIADKFVNLFLTTDFVRFIHNAYRFIYNGIIYNYIAIIFISILIFFLIFIRSI